MSLKACDARRIGRFIAASTVLFVIALVWNALVHLVILKEMDALVANLRRPDMAELWWLSLMFTLGLTASFIWGYSRFARDSSVREGLRYGLYFAVLAGLFVDLNQFVLYPLPATVALQWFGAGVLEFSVYGVLVTRLYPVSGATLS